MIRHLFLYKFLFGAIRRIFIFFSADKYLAPLRMVDFRRKDLRVSEKEPEEVYCGKDCLPAV